MLRGDAVSIGAEVRLGRLSARDDFVHSPQALVDLAGGVSFEAAELREGILEIVEALVLRLGAPGLCGELLDQFLQALLADGEGIQFRLSHHEGLVAVVRRDEAADHRDAEFFVGLHVARQVLRREPTLKGVEHVGVAVHFLILDEGAAEDELRNEDERHEHRAGLGVRHQRGDEQAEGNPADGGEERPQEIRPEHSAHAEDVVAEAHEEPALQRGENAQGQEFCGDVVGHADIEIALTLEDRPIADDVLDAIHQREEERDEQADENVGRDVKRRCEDVGTVRLFGVIERSADDIREERRREQCDEEAGDVAEFRQECAAQQDVKMEPFLAPADLPRCGFLAGLGEGGSVRSRRVRLSFQRHLLHLLCEPIGLVSVAPEVGGKTSRRDELAVAAFLENQVATQVVQRCFEDVEAEFRTAALGLGHMGRGDVFLDSGLREVAHHLVRRPVEDELAAAIEQHGFVEKMEQPRARLMDDDEDDLVVRKAADDVDDVLAVLRADAAGRFVEQENVRRADHIEADIQSLPLAAGERLLFRRTDDDIAPLAEAEFDHLAFDPPRAVAAAEMGGADGCGVVEIFLDGQVVVERVILRDVGDEAFELFEVAVEFLPIQQDVTARRRETSGDGAEERAFSRAASAHHAHDIAARECEIDPVECRDVAAEVAGDIAQFERGDDVPFLFDDAFAEVAPQPLARIDADEIVVLEITASAHGDDPIAHDDRAVGGDDVELPDLVVVIAVDLEEDFAGCAGRKKDVVHFEQARVVGDGVGILVALQRKADAECAGAAAEIGEREFGVVVKDDAILLRRVQHRPGAQGDTVEDRVHIGERAHLDLQAEPHFERTVPGADAGEFDFVVFIDFEIDVREEDALLRVEERDDVLVGQHLLIENHALAGEDTGEGSRGERTTADVHWTLSGIF